MRYRRIMPRIWHDEKFCVLPPNEKLIVLYLLTSPESNRIGLYRITIEKAAADVGLDPETFRDGFRNVCQTFGWSFDRVSKTLFLRSWWRYNKPDNTNILKGNLQDLGEVPSNPYFTEFFDLTCHYQGVDETFLEPYRKVYLTSPEPLPIQEQYQEQEQEQDQEGANAPSALIESASNGTEPKPQRKRPDAKPMTDPIGHSEYLLQWWPILIELLKATHPHAKIPKDGSLEWYQWRDTIAKLVRIDNFEEKDVTRTLQWLYESDHKDALFWRGQVVSFAALRKSSDGMTKFYKIYNKRKFAIKSSMTQEDKYEHAIVNGTLT